MAKDKKSDDVKERALEAKSEVKKEAPKAEAKPEAKKEAAKPAPKVEALKNSKEDTHCVLVDSITSKRGVLLKDQGCRVNDFPGGDKQLEEMVTKKLIKKL